MNWRKIRDGAPRDGRFVLAYLWVLDDHPMMGIEPRPLFLRWNGDYWIDSSGSVVGGDTAVAVWVEQEPPSAKEISGLFGISTPNAEKLLPNYGSVGGRNYG